MAYSCGSRQYQKFVCPHLESTPAEVARYKELSRLVGNPTEPVVNECNFRRTWLTQGVKAIRVVRTQADGRDEEVTAQCGNLYFYTYKQIFDCHFKCGDRSIFAKPLGEVVEADYLWLPGIDEFGLVTPPNPDHLKQRIVLRLADGTEIEKELSEKGKNKGTRSRTALPEEGKYANPRPL